MGGSGTTVAISYVNAAFSLKEPNGVRHLPINDDRQLLLTFDKVQQSPATFLFLSPHFGFHMTVGDSSNDREFDCSTARSASSVAPFSYLAQVSGSKSPWAINIVIYSVYSGIWNQIKLFKVTSGTCRPVLRKIDHSVGAQDLCALRDVHCSSLCVHCF